MKKIFLALLFVGIVVLPFVASAALTPPTGTVGSASAGTSIPTTDVENTVNALTNWFFALFLIVAVWFLILAGFHFVTANGDTEAVNKARGEVMYAAIGILIAVLSKGIVSLAFGLAKQ